MRYTRPVWRRFVPRFASNAIEWVRRGGHAVIVHRPSRIELLLGADGEGKLTEQGLWAVLALEQRRPRKVASGAGKGLFTILAAPHAREAALDWCERDSQIEGPTRTMELECLECAACCHASNVILDEDDLEVFRAGGRPELTRPPYVKRSRDGKLRLRFAKDSDCQHLARDKKCRIYPIRPFNCAVFPAGTEACLAARESTLSIRDDADNHPL